jgi:hypothetical protein
VFLTVPAPRILALTIANTKPVIDDDGEEFELPDDGDDSESDSLLTQPTVDHSKDPLTPKSNTLCTDTVDSNAEPLVTDLEYFFEVFPNKNSNVIRRCKACL